jgi:hypothetical protein
VPTKEIGSQRLSRYSQLLSTRLEAQSQPELEVATLIKGSTGNTLRTTLLALDEQGNSQLGGFEVQGLDVPVVVVECVV